MDHPDSQREGWGQWTSRVQELDLRSKLNQPNKMKNKLMIRRINDTLDRLWTACGLIAMKE